MLLCEENTGRLLQYERNEGGLLSHWRPQNCLVADKAGSLHFAEVGRVCFGVVHDRRDGGFFVRYPDGSQDTNSRQGKAFRVENDALKLNTMGSYVSEFFVPDANQYH